MVVRTCGIVDPPRRREARLDPSGPEPYDQAAVVDPRPRPDRDSPMAPAYTIASLLLALFSSVSPTSMYTWRRSTEGQASRRSTLRPTSGRPVPSGSAAYLHAGARLRSGWSRAARTLTEAASDALGDFFLLPPAWRRGGPRPFEQQDGRGPASTVADTGSTWSYRPRASSVDVGAAGAAATRSSASSACEARAVRIDSAAAIRAPHRPAPETGL